ncbi:hypothetical protein QTP88_001775 [Uroleucon formosanum]
MGNLIKQNNSLLESIEDLKKNSIIEGEFRFGQLEEFLEKNKLPMCVWIREDAVRITSKIEYNSSSNKIVGFVVPFKNGMAEVDAFLATLAYA